MDGVRVLVVDDDVDTAEMTAQGLAGYGYETHVAHDEATALELATELSPPLAILDIQLAQSSGVGSSRVDLQACKLEYSIVSPK